MNDIIKSIEDAQLREVADFRTGDTVKFAFDAEKIHVFDKETEEVITN